ncbi:MarR family transcriptional regulator [Micromonospora humida]|uniref:MarR family transcriptional regulator n=1 Tax=Micromonospora humida TaxID=2809018 RepID=UPI00340B1922
MSIDAVLDGLLVRQLDHWLPGALHRSRRATLALAYAGDPGSAEAALRVVAGFADRLRGRRLTVLVLADGGPELPARLGVVEAGLPGDVAVHVVPGDPARLPVVLKAAGAAGAPLLTLLDDAAPTPALLAATTTGRPAEVLLTGTGTDLRPALTAAGFPLVAEVELVPADGTPARLVAFGTGLDKSLEAFKDALWATDADGADGIAVRYRDPAGGLLDVGADPVTGPLRDELLAELTRHGPRTVTELRRHAMTATAYRAGDAGRALAELLDAGLVTRDPEHGRLGGDVLISAGPAPAARSTA